jgi:hypothetical protein
MTMTDTTNITLTRKKPTNLDTLLRAQPAGSLDEAFWDGVRAYLDRGRIWARFYTPSLARAAFAELRGRYGLQPVAVRLLTPPENNLKLAKSERVTYGLTLQSAVTRLDGYNVEACPWRTQGCTAVCVVRKSGKGGVPLVDKGRIAKTAFLAEYPHAFMTLLGFELAAVVAKHDKGIDFRPNVNSDVSWHEFTPSLFNGPGPLAGVWSYGYTKNPRLLDPEWRYNQHIRDAGWVQERYRLVFSVSEHHGIHEPEVRAFLADGGSVAVVTNRKAHNGTYEPVQQWDGKYEVVDASKDDGWVWESSVIGDLAAKGRARTLPVTNWFVHRCY